MVAAIALLSPGLQRAARQQHKRRRQFWLYGVAIGSDRMRVRGVDPLPKIMEENFASAVGLMRQGGMVKVQNKVGWEVVYGHEALFHLSFHS